MGRVSSIKKVKTPWVGQKLGKAQPWMVGGSIGKVLRVKPMKMVGQTMQRKPNASIGLARKPKRYTRAK